MIFIRKKFFRNSHHSYRQPDYSFNLFCHSVMTSVYQKLRWILHYWHLFGHISRCIKFLRSLTGTQWGSHPSALLLIFNSIVKAKVDYSSFLYSSASLLQKKIQFCSKCLRSTSIRGTICSALSLYLEVKCSCPPIELCSRRLAGKCILKYMFVSSFTLFTDNINVYKKFLEIR